MRETAPKAQCAVDTVRLTHGTVRSEGVHLRAKTLLRRLMNKCMLYRWFALGSTCENTSSCLQRVRMQRKATFSKRNHLQSIHHALLRRNEQAKRQD